MSATLFKQVNYPLSFLIENIELGVIGLPEIQRPFVWGNAKVRDLFDSMFKGFPVGYFLFWQNGAGNGHKQIGTNSKQKVPNLLIVDGQQRLTSLYAVMKGKPVVRENFEKEKIYIAFNPVKRIFAVADAAVLKDPEFIPDISLVWSDKNGIFGIAKEYLGRIRLSRSISDDEEIAIQNAINDLDNIQNYPFTALEVSSSANEEQVSEIFVRVNSKGTPLNQADFILTLMSVFWDEGRTALENFCRESRIQPKDKPSPFNYFIQPGPDQLVRTTIGVGFKRARLNYAYLILRGKDLETEEFSDERREKQFSIYADAQAKVLNLTNWHEFLKAILLAGFVSEQVISSQTAILYAYVFYLIGKYDYAIDHAKLREIIAKWFFMISLTSRYSGSFESLMEQDLNRLKEIRTGQEFLDLLEHIIFDSLTDDYWNITLPNQLETSSARTPALMAYYASLVKLNAPVLFSNLSVSNLLDPSIKGKKSAIERHHLFPRGYLNQQGIKEIRDTNQVGNFALVEWSDNIDISDESPAKYFPKYIKKYSEEEWKRINFLHALPEKWYELNYQEFLELRKKAIAEVIREGFNTLA
ncbi:MAG: GmrSD restriction endonuclease domain-containing protein [Bellilinea sp.]